MRNGKVLTGFRYTLARYAENMATLKKYHHYVRKKEFDKCSLGIREIFPIEDRTVSDLFAAQYEDTTNKRVENATSEEKMEPAIPE